MKKTRMARIAATVAAAATLMTSLALPSSAAAGPLYYKPDPYVWGSGYPNMYWGSAYWSTGALLWKKEWQQDFYLTRRWRRPQAYYTDYWIANQGQTLTITTTKTCTNTIGSSVTSEISASYSGIGAKVGGVMTTSTSCTFSAALSMTYDLKKYSQQSVRLANMVYICEFDSPKFCDGAYHSSELTYAYDTSLGNEFALVYRY